MSEFYLFFVEIHLWSLKAEAWNYRLLLKVILNMAGLTGHTDTREMWAPIFIRLKSCVNVGNAKDGTTCKDATSARIEDFLPALLGLASGFSPPNLVMALHIRFFRVQSEIFTFIVHRTALIPHGPFFSVKRSDSGISAESCHENTLTRHN